MGSYDERVKLDKGFTDLGREETYYGGCEPIAAAPPEKDKKTKIYYPTMYLNGIQGLAELGDEGTATIRYKKLESTKREVERDGEKKTEYSCELEIHGIKGNPPAKAIADSKSTDDEALEAIDKGLNEAEKSDADEEEND